jgi:hypothetical protein
MGLLYIFGATSILVATWILVDRLRLRQLRRERQKMGRGRDQFLDAFQSVAIPLEIPSAVFEYYSSMRGWRDFPFAPDDMYSKVLHDDPWDLHNDELALVARLGMKLPPEYILRTWPGKSIETLRDMVMWLDWIRQHQPAGVQPFEPSADSSSRIPRSE